VQASDSVELDHGVADDLIARARADCAGDRVHEDHCGGARNRMLDAVILGKILLKPVNEPALVMSEIAAFNDLCQIRNLLFAECPYRS